VYGALEELLAFGSGIWARFPMPGEPPFSDHRPISEDFLNTTSQPKMNEYALFYLATAKKKVFYY
jgi:hypothetical protein